jgi:hypothetical protein
MAQLQDDAQAVAKTDLADSLNEFTGRIGRREIVVVCSDFFGEA